MKRLNIYDEILTREEDINFIIFKQDIHQL